MKPLGSFSSSTFFLLIPNSVRPRQPGNRQPNEHSLECRVLSVAGRRRTAMVTLVSGRHALSPSSVGRLTISGFSRNPSVTVSQMLALPQ
jgi:hypothetical protein